MAIRCLLKKDFRNLSRAPQAVLAVIFFAFVLVVLSSISFRQIGYGEAELRGLTPGVLWLIFLFGGIQCLNYSFVSEREWDALSGLMLSPVDPGQVYVAKMISNFVFLTAVQIIVILSHSLFSGLNLAPVLPSLFVLTLFTAFGFTALGTLLAGVAAGARGRDILLPLVLFPLAVPLLAAAVFLTGEVLESGGFSPTNFWFELIAGYDVLAFTLSYVLFEFVARD